MIAVQAPSQFHYNSLSRSIDIPSSATSVAASISPRNAFLSRENKICGIGSSTGSTRGLVENAIASEPVLSQVSSRPSTTQLYTKNSSFQPFQDSSFLPLPAPVNALKDEELPSSTSIATPGNQIVPIFDARTSTTSRLVIRSKPKKQAMSGRLRNVNNNVPWVHTTPNDLWRVVQPVATDSAQPKPQPHQQPSRRSLVGDEVQDPGLRASSLPLQPIARPVQKAIGSERKQRMQQQTQLLTQPVVIQPLVPSSTTIPPPSPPLTPKPVLGDSTQFSPQVSTPLIESTRHGVLSPLPDDLPTPPPTPQLTVVSLPAAPEPQIHPDTLFRRDLVVAFNAQRSRHGKQKYTPRFSSSLNPAREKLSEQGVTLRDLFDVDRYEREKMRAVQGGREKAWNYFRKQQLVGWRSRAVCERWSSVGGSHGVSSYLRGHDQKHCLGCRREGLRVRLMVVGSWSSDFGMEDDEVEIDADDVLEGVEKVKFVMDYWDDDDEGAPMDVDSSNSSRIDAELAKSLLSHLDDSSNMDVDEFKVKEDKTHWVGGVPESPRLKDLDDFDEM